MRDNVYIYSEQPLTPRAAEVLVAVKTELGLGNLKFYPVTSAYQVKDTKKVLVFGSKLPDGVWYGVEFVHTYSIAQLMSKPNAASVLASSLNIYLGQGHVVPEDIMPKGIFYGFTARESLEQIDYDAPTAIDIETSGNLGKEHTPEEVEVISIALYQEGSPPLVFSAGYVDGKYVNGLACNLEMWTALALALPKFTKAIYHNGKFDIRVLNRYFGISLVNWFDTMLAHHTLNHAAGEHGLKALSSRYLGAPDWEDGIKKYTKGGGYYERIPLVHLVQYNGWDVYWTFQLWKLFAPLIEAEENYSKCFMFEMAEADMLLKVESNGVPLDMEKTKALESRLTEIKEYETAYMQNLLGDSMFNPNSPQQVTRAFAFLGVTAKDTSKESVSGIVKIFGEESKPGKFGQSLLAYRNATKALSTYVKAWSAYARLDWDGSYRIHPTFLVHGTTTGRLSSTSPNVQNMPRDKKTRQIVGLS